MKITAPSDMVQFGTILGVWAHPDDETWSMAGLAMLALANNQRVVCITATRGEQGSSDEKKWPKTSLGDVREHELDDALKILGIKEHHWLGYPDGGCISQASEQAVAKIVDIMKTVRPDTVLSFGPDGMTGHDDHKTVFKWAVQAVKMLDYQPQIYTVIESKQWYETEGKELDKKFNIYFNIDEPPLIEEEKADLQCCLSQELAERKLDALRAQTSQTEAMFADGDLQALFDNAACELFMRL